MSNAEDYYNSDRYIINKPALKAFVYTTHRNVRGLKLNSISFNNLMFYISNKTDTNFLKFRIDGKDIKVMIPQGLRSIYFLEEHINEELKEFKSFCLFRGLFNY